MGLSKHSYSRTYLITPRCKSHQLGALDLLLEADKTDDKILSADLKLMAATLYCGIDKDKKIVEGIMNSIARTVPGYDPSLRGIGSPPCDDDPLFEKKRDFRMKYSHLSLPLIMDKLSEYVEKYSHNLY